MSQRVFDICDNCGKEEQRIDSDEDSHFRSMRPAGWIEFGLCANGIAFCGDCRGLFEQTFPRTAKLIRADEEIESKQRVHRRHS